MFYEKKINNHALRQGLYFSTNCQRFAVSSGTFARAAASKSSSMRRRMRALGPRVILREQVWSRGLYLLFSCRPESLTAHPHLPLVVQARRVRTVVDYRCNSNLISLRLILFYPRHSTPPPPPSPRPLAPSLPRRRLIHSPARCNSRRTRTDPESNLLPRRSCRSEYRLTNERAGVYDRQIDRSIEFINELYSSGSSNNGDSEEIYPSETIGALREIHANRLRKRRLGRGFFVQLDLSLIRY